MKADYHILPESENGNSSKKLPDNSRYIFLACLFLPCKFPGKLICPKSGPTIQLFLCLPENGKVEFFNLSASDLMKKLSSGRMLY